MARYDVYANPTAGDRSHTPYVLDVQSNHLLPLVTRVVIPLRTAKALPTPAHGLNPALQVEGKAVVLDAASLAPVPVAMLRRPVANLTPQSGAVLDALDTLFGSY